MAQATNRPSLLYASMTGAAGKSIEPPLMPLLAVRSSSNPNGQVSEESSGERGNEGRAASSSSNVDHSPLELFMAKIAIWAPALLQVTNRCLKGDQFLIHAANRLGDRISQVPIGAVGSSSNARQETSVLVREMMKEGVSGGILSSGLLEAA
jgi:hypothetical protein